MQYICIYEKIVVTLQANYFVYEKDYSFCTRGDDDGRVR